MNMTNRVFLLCALIFSAAAAVGTDSPPNDAFIKAVSALPAEQQIGAVSAKLKELNPNFDGKETHKIENGVVTALSFSTVGVTDISPVKALRWLRTLTITPPALNQKGSLENLAPLQGMQLTWLWCHNNPITDLSPLQGMPLTVLSFSGTQVSNLSPLAGMKLQVLSFNDTVVSDIAPLEGTPLTVFWCNNTKVTDLTPLKTMPLQELKCDQPVAAQNAAVLRSIRTLAKINDLPTATFWARVGPIAATTPAATTTKPGQRGELKSTLPTALTMQTSTGGSVSAKEQIRRFVEQMKQLNPAWDGQVDFKGEGSKVVELRFSAEGVTDISPVSALRTLQNLDCSALNGRKTALADLTPLRGLPLETLFCSGWTSLSDLTPLKGMKLTKFGCNWSKVTDLSPLQSMPVWSLDIHNTNVSDLSPMRGMKKLLSLHLTGCPVQDLSPLKGTSIQSLRFDVAPERDTKILRSIATIRTINDLPVDEFWRRVKAGNVPVAK